MKEGKGSLALIWAFILVCFTGSAFYILADFGKAITKQGGLGWLAVSIVLLIALLCKARKLFLLCAGIVALIQVPILIYCLDGLGGRGLSPVSGIRSRHRLVGGGSRRCAAFFALHLLGQYKGAYTRAMDPHLLNFSELVQTCCIPTAEMVT